MDQVVITPSERAPDVGGKRAGAWILPPPDVYLANRKIPGLSLVEQLLSLPYAWFLGDA